MSSQRVFESARKLGVPVIVTDPSGRDPMVVLPLDQFEAMAGDGGKSEIGSGKSGTPVRPAESRRAAPAADDLPPSFGDLAVSMLQNDEIPLEERFYLEPMDDEKGL